MVDYQNNSTELLFFFSKGNKRRTARSGEVSLLVGCFMALWLTWAVVRERELGPFPFLRCFSAMCYHLINYQEKREVGKGGVGRRTPCQGRLRVWWLAL